MKEQRERLQVENRNTSHARNDGQQAHDKQFASQRRDTWYPHEEGFETCI